jgi:hypothetical protein
MRNLLVFCFALLPLVASAAVQEKVIGKVIAVERNFGTADQTALTAALAPGTYTGQFHAEVVLSPKKEGEAHVSRTKEEYKDDTCQVELASSNQGYEVSVFFSWNISDGATRDMAIACVNRAFQEKGFGSVVLKTIVHTIK